MLSVFPYCLLLTTHKHIQWQKREDLHFQTLRTFDRQLLYSSDTLFPSLDCLPFRPTFSTSPEPQPYTWNLNCFVVEKSPVLRLLGKSRSKWRLNRNFCAQNASLLSFELFTPAHFSPAMYKLLPKVPSLKMDYFGGLVSMPFFIIQIIICQTRKRSVYIYLVFKIL